MASGMSAWSMLRGEYPGRRPTRARERGRARVCARSPRPTEQLLACCLPTSLLLRPDSSQWVLPTAVCCWSSAAGGRPIGSCDHSLAFSLSLAEPAPLSCFWQRGQEFGPAGMRRRAERARSMRLARDCWFRAPAAASAASVRARAQAACGRRAPARPNCALALAPPRRHRQRARARGWLVRGTSRPH